MAAADIVVDIHDVLNMDWEVTYRGQLQGLRDTKYSTTFAAPRYVRDIRKIVIETFANKPQLLNIEFLLRLNVANGAAIAFLREYLHRIGKRLTNVVRINNLSYGSAILSEICEVLHISQADIAMELQRTVAAFTAVPKENFSRRLYNKLPSILSFRDCLRPTPLMAQVAPDQDDATAPLAVVVRERRSSSSSSYTTTRRSHSFSIAD